MNKLFHCSMQSVTTPSKCFRVSLALYITEVSHFVLLFHMWWMAFATIFFSIFRSESVDICEPREGKVVVIMKMSNTTLCHTQSDLGCQCSWKEMEIGVFSQAVNIVRKQALQWALIATVCAGVCSEHHVAHVDTVWLVSPLFFFFLSAVFHIG